MGILLSPISTIHKAQSLPLQLISTRSLWFGLSSFVQAGTLLIIGHIFISLLLTVQIPIGFWVKSHLRNIIFYSLKFRPRKSQYCAIFHICYFYLYSFPYVMPR